MSVRTLPARRAGSAARRVAILVVALGVTATAACGSPGGWPHLAVRNPARPRVSGKPSATGPASRAAAATPPAVGTGPVFLTPHPGSVRPEPAVARAPAPGCPVAPYGPHTSATGPGRTVALTFDDGPGRSTAAILAILARYHVPATFFNIGLSMTARPALVRQEASGGYVLGDHTWDHADMAALPAAAQAAEIDRVAAEQRALTGTVPCAFRPPSGDYSAVTLALAWQRRMVVWLWSVDTQDWMADGSASPYWVQRIIRLAEAEGGRLPHPVVLMHNQVIGNPATVSALPVIIEFFRSRGYTFVAL